MMLSLSFPPAFTSHAMPSPSTFENTFSDASADVSSSAYCSRIDTRSIAGIAGMLVVDTHDQLAHAAAVREDAETRLTAIDCKGDAGETLTAEDLSFLDGRGMVARKLQEISKETRAYVGALPDGFFAALPVHLKHIYTSFPEGRISFESLDIGGMTAEELEAALDREDATRKKQFNISKYARSMLRNEKQFVEPVNARRRERGESLEMLDLVRLRVRDLGYDDPDNLPTTRDLFGDPGKRNGRIHKLGLELCPTETGPYKRLADTDQPLGNWYAVGMESVAVSDGDPDVFDLGRDGGGLWLDDGWAGPGDRWDLGHEILLRRRKSAT